MELEKGIEPPTRCLQGSCSTIEPLQRGSRDRICTRDQRGISSPLSTTELHGYKWHYRRSHANHFRCSLFFKRYDYIDGLANYIEETFIYNQLRNFPKIYKVVHECLAQKPVYKADWHAYGVINEPLMNRELLFYLDSSKVVCNTRSYQSRFIHASS